LLKFIFIATKSEGWPRVLVKIEMLKLFGTITLKPLGQLMFFSLYQQTLALTSPTSGGHSVGIVRSRTKATELFIYINF
jgi:hypothetical protein